MDCPKCLGKLEEKELVVHTASQVEELKGAVLTQVLAVDQCFVCGGVWFDRGELDKYTTERMTIVDSPSLGEKLDRELDEKKGKCPRCKVPLNKMPYEKEPSITIDLCPQCMGIWLDSTEVDRVERANKQKIGFWGLFFKGFQKRG